jgi:hypothetical protein
MAQAAAPTEALRRERAFLALLLLVGSGSIGAGLYEVVRTNSSSLAAVLDLTLGACVLLVTWLFLAPSAYPSFFGDPSPGEVQVERPYLRPVAPSELLPSSSTVAPLPPAHAIPKWADPLVGTPVQGAIRPSARPGALFGAKARGLSDVEPVTPRSSVASTSPAPPDPLDVGSIWEDPLEFEDRPRALDASRRGAAASGDMLAELDKIEAELRAFSPLEGPSGNEASPTPPHFDAFSD